MDDASEYIKKELISYIDNEFKRGKSLEQIRNTLLNAGHNEDIIDLAIKHLQKHNFNIVKAMQDDVEIDREVYYDVLNGLIRYVEYLHSQKVPINKIKRTLLEYGHAKEDIDAAINEVLKKNRLDFKKFIMPAAILSYAIFIIVLSSTAGEPISKVFIGLFVPVFTIMLDWMIVVKELSKLWLWIVPVLSSVLFIYVIRAAPSTYAGMNVSGLLVLNLFISVIYSYIFSLYPARKSFKKAIKIEKKPARKMKRTTL